MKSIGVISSNFPDTKAPRYVLMACCSIHITTEHHANKRTPRQHTTNHNFISKPKN